MNVATVCTPFPSAYRLLTEYPDGSIRWDKTIAWLRQNTKLEIWLKGGTSMLTLAATMYRLTRTVYSPEDIQLAIDHKVDGVVISNHGGRQLDGVPATLDALRICAPVAKGKIPLAVDGGIRRGSDVFKAIALGASMCFVGRIPIWGLAVSFTHTTIFVHDIDSRDSITAKKASI